MITLFGTFFLRFYFVCVSVVLNEGFRCVCMSYPGFISMDYIESKNKKEKLEIVLANKPLSTSWCTEMFPLCRNCAHRGPRLNIFFRLCIFVLLFF